MRRIESVDSIFDNNQYTFSKKYVIVNEYEKEQFLRNYVLNTLNRQLINTTFISLNDLCKQFIISKSLHRDFTIIDDDKGVEIISEIISNHAEDFVYFRDEINSLKLSKKVYKSIQESRLSLEDDNITFQDKEFEEYLIIYIEFNSYLVIHNYLDYADILEISTQNPVIFDDNALYLVFNDSLFTEKESKLIESLSSTFNLKYLDIYSPNHQNLDGQNVYFYKARGKRNEVYNVFDIIKNKGLCLNDIEILYTDKSYLEYLSVISDILDVKVSINDGYTLKRTLTYETLYNLYMYLLDNYKSEYLIRIDNIGLFRGNIKPFKDVLKMSKYIKPEDLSSYGEYVSNRHLEYKELYDNYVDYDVKKDIEFFNDLSNLTLNKYLDESINYYSFTDELIIFLNKYKKIKSERESIEKIVIEKLENFKILSKNKTNSLFSYFNELFTYLESFSISYNSTEESNGILIRSLSEKRPLSRKYVFILGLNSDTTLNIIKDNPIFLDKYISKFPGYLSSKEKNNYNLNVIRDNIFSFNGDELHLSYVYYDELENIELSPIFLFDEIRGKKVIKEVEFKIDDCSLSSIKIYQDVSKSDFLRLNDVLEVYHQEDGCDLYHVKNTNNNYLEKLSMNVTSASKLIMLLENPLNSLFINGLLMKKDEEIIIKNGYWLSSSDRGNLMHKILEIYFNKMIDDHKELNKPCFLYDEVYLNQIIDDMCSYWKRRYPPLFEKCYENEKNLIKKTLNKYVYQESLHNNADILGCEISFGNACDKKNENISPMKISLDVPLFKEEIFDDNNRTFTLVSNNNNDNQIDLLIIGSIDRLDYDKDNNKLIFVDYKTGKAENFKLYKAIQGRIYELAFKEYIKCYPDKFEDMDFSNLQVEYRFIFINIDDEDDLVKEKVFTYQVIDEINLNDDSLGKDDTNIYLPMSLLSFNLQLINNFEISSRLMDDVFKSFPFLSSKDWFKDNWKYAYSELKDIW